MKQKPLTNIKESLRELLLQGTASSQHELEEQLTKLGHKVNQSKISRLLKKLNAIKVQDILGKVRYSLPKEPAPPSTSSSISNLIIDIVCNESLIVVHTNPGSASLIARVLDQKSGEIGILGSVAGDDTIFIAPLSIKKISSVTQTIKNLLTYTGKTIK
jgi:transcriptional regulator of arginine metabolism